MRWWGCSLDQFPDLMRHFPFLALSAEASGMEGRNLPPTTMTLFHQCRWKVKVPQQPCSHDSKPPSLPHLPPLRSRGCSGGGPAAAAAAACSSSRPRAETDVAPESDQHLQQAVFLSCSRDTRALFHRSLVILRPAHQSLFPSLL